MPNLMLFLVESVLFLVAMRDARKLFRLFKSINEYQKILDLLAK